MLISSYFFPPIEVGINVLAVLYKRSNILVHYPDPLLENTGQKDVSTQPTVVKNADIAGQRIATRNYILGN